MIKLHVYFEMTAKTFEGFVVTEAKQHQSHLGGGSKLHIFAALRLYRICRQLKPEQ